MTRPVLAGIFVGGAATRMGGVAKGLLLTQDGVSVVDRWLEMLGGLGLDVVLVGGGAAYRGYTVEQLDDRPPGIGPLGGLVALLDRAGNRAAFAVACDMPFVSRRLVERLLGAAADAAVVAPRRDRRWEPLCARYDAARVLPVASRRTQEADRSLQRLLDELGAVGLSVDAREASELRDWDTPDDLLRAPPGT